MENLEIVRPHSCWLYQTLLLFLLLQAFPSREPETVLQRYHRLKQEVIDLVSEVEGMEGSKELGNVSTGDIISDVSHCDILYST